MSNFTRDECFTTTVAKDFFELMVGPEVGRGAYRTVYRHSLNPDYVIKIEDAAHSFHNIQEWDVWERVKYTKHAKWFAPCEHISPNGAVLIQKFAKNIEDDSLLPDKIPIFLTDISKRNFGIIDNQIVCRDYGLNLLMEKGMTSKLKKVNW